MMGLGKQSIPKADSKACFSPCCETKTTTMNQEVLFLPQLDFGVCRANRFN
jgi:hypothetical protein